MGGSAVAEAGVIERIPPTVTKPNRKALESLFDQQMERLVELEYPKKLKVSEQEFVNRHLIPLREMLGSMGSVHEGDGYIPLLIVVRPVLVPYGEQVGNDLTGKNHLGNNEFTWSDECPVQKLSPCYLVCDVEDGRSCLAQSYLTSINDFKGVRRMGLTLEEGIALLRYKPEIIEHHNISLPGTLFRGRYVPKLFTSNYRVEVFISHGDKDPGEGAASCSRRLAYKCE